MRKLGLDGQFVGRLTSSSGTITDTYDYDAFGNELHHTGTTPNSYLYRGEQYDSDLGLYYLRARYYNSLTGRFMSRDPENGKQADPKTLHKCLYAEGDPIDGIDPSGRADLLELDIRFKSFLKKAPTLTEWGIELADCVLAIADELNSNIFGEGPGMKANQANLAADCTVFFFNSFRIIYAATP